MFRRWERGSTVPREEILSNPWLSTVISRCDARIHTTRISYSVHRLSSYTLAGNLSCQTSVLPLYCCVYSLKTFCLCLSLSKSKNAPLTRDPSPSSLRLVSPSFLETLALVSVSVSFSGRAGRRHHETKRNETHARTHARTRGKQLPRPYVSIRPCSFFTSHRWALGFSSSWRCTRCASSSCLPPTALCLGL